MYPRVLECASFNLKLQSCLLTSLSISCSLSLSSRCRRWYSSSSSSLSLISVMLFFRSLIPGWDLPDDTFLWTRGLVRGEEPDREPRLKAGDSAFPKLAFLIPAPPTPPSIIVEVGEGLRARMPRLNVGSSDVEQDLDLTLWLSQSNLLGLELLSSVLNVETVSGSTFSRTGTPLRTTEGLSGGSSLMLLPPPLPTFDSMFLLAMRGLTGGCRERGCCWSVVPWRMWTLGSSGGWLAWPGCCSKVGGQSASSLKGLQGLSCSIATDLVFELENDSEEQVGNFWASLGLPGTKVRLLRGSVNDTWEVARRLSLQLSPLRPSLGLCGESPKIFLWIRGLSLTLSPALMLSSWGSAVRGWGMDGGWAVKL